MPANKDNQDIQEIKQMLTTLHHNMQQILNQNANINNQAALAGIKRDYTNILINHVNNDINQDLEKHMTKPCEKREYCKNVLSGFLEKNGTLIKQKVDDKTINSNRQQLLQIAKDNDTTPGCKQCFSEAQNIFEKQATLMRSLQIYEAPEESTEDLLAVPEKLLVTDLLEPLSNIQRLQIMKAVATKTQTFSEFTELTGLRGGNLLFHIQKLIDAGMIIQRHERGDYMITDKGFKALKGIAGTYSKVSQE